MADHATGSWNEEEDNSYHPRDAISETVNAAAVTGTAGLFMSAVQNTLSKTTLGAFGLFTRYGRTTGYFAGAGASYAFISTASANLRHKEDLWNHVYGGFASGSLIGFSRGRGFPAVVGLGLFMGSALGVLSYTGGVVFATGETAEERIERKEEHRRRFRRPYQEMVNEIGEGRGIYPPGYDERRKQRLKDGYGIEVQQPYYERKRALGLAPDAVI